MYTPPASHRGWRRFSDIRQREFHFRYGPRADMIVGGIFFCMRAAELSLWER